MHVSAYPSKASTWARQVAYAHAAETFLDACEVANIDALPVKGIVSGSTLYDDRADRPLTDVDVRVAPRDLKRVARLCKTRGWPIVQRMRSYGTIVTIVDRVDIDVESHVGPPGLCDLDVNTMIARAQRSDLLGFAARVPSFADHAVVLIVNAFKDKLAGAFEWAIRDLERVVLAREFDCDALVQRLRETGSTTLAWITAEWMIRERNARRWADVRDALGRPRRLYARTMARLTRGPSDSLLLRILSRVAADRPMARVRSLAHLSAWELEAALSQFGPTPYNRGEVITHAERQGTSRLPRT